MRSKTSYLEKGKRNRTIGCGVVGVANFGARRRKVIAAHGGFRILGVVDANAARAESAAAEEGCRAYASVEEMAKDPEIEAVFLSSPPQYHIPQAWQVVHAGKALFTEKPLGANLWECEELVEHCEEVGIPHGHGFTMREGGLPLIRSWIEEGLLGRVVSVSARVMHSGGWVGSPTDWRADRKKNPGGPLFQLGTHYIDALRFLFGEGVWYAAHSTSDITKSAVDDSFVAMGTFGPVPCTLHSHYVCAERCGMEIYGTKATLIWEANLPRLRFRPMRPQAIEPEEDWTDRLCKSSSDFSLMEDFHQAITEWRQPCCNGRDALAVITLVHQAVQLASCDEPTHPFPVNKSLTVA